MAESRSRPKGYFESLSHGMQPTGVRQSNQRAVLSVLSNNSGLSNADVARRTGLAAQSVSAVLGDLERAGLARRGEAVRGGRRGQPATPFFVDPTGAYAFGVEVGWSHLEVVLVNIGIEILARRRVNYERPDPAWVVAELAAAVAEMLRFVPVERREHVIGMGLAAPEGIAEPDHDGLPADEAQRWAGFDLGAAVAAATGLDVARFNNGSAACWAEFVALPPPRPGNFAYLLVDTMVEAGLVAEDRLWHGFGGASASLGSMLVSDRDNVRLFVDDVASVGALGGRLQAGGFERRAALSETPPSGVASIVDRWVDDAAHVLAQAVLNANTVLEIEFAIIEAELPVALRDRLVAAVARDVLALPSRARSRPVVTAGRLGRSGAAQGAAFLRLYRRFFSRELAHMED